MITCYISIGNSDDKLPQTAWSHFCGELVRLVMTDARFHNVHGIWYSESSAEYQNMCVCTDVSEKDMQSLRAELKALRQEFGQDSIALAPVTRTEFL